MEITETKDVWLVISNTDLNEGRGSDFVASVCESQATAMRIGERGYVQGSKCPIRKGIGVKIKNTWYYPSEIEPMTKDDKNKQRLIDAKEAAYEKAKSAGLSDDEIAMLRL